MFAKCSKQFTDYFYRLPCTVKIADASDVLQDCVGVNVAVFARPALYNAFAQEKKVAKLDITRFKSHGELDADHFSIKLTIDHDFVGFLPQLIATLHARYDSLFANRTTICKADYVVKVRAIHAEETHHDLTNWDLHAEFLKLLFKGMVTWTLKDTWTITSSVGDPTHTVGGMMHF